MNLCGAGPVYMKFAKGDSVRYCNNVMFFFIIYTRTFDSSLDIHSSQNSNYLADSFSWDYPVD